MTAESHIFSFELRETVVLMWEHNSTTNVEKMTQRSLYGVIDFEQGFFLTGLIAYWMVVVMEITGHMKGGGGLKGDREEVQLHQAEKPEFICDGEQSGLSLSPALIPPVFPPPAQLQPPRSPWDQPWQVRPPLCELTDCPTFSSCTLVPAAWMMDLEVESCWQRLIRLLLLICCVTLHSSAIETGKTLTFLTPSPWDSRRTRGPHSVFKWRTCEKWLWFFLIWYVSSSDSGLIIIVF